MSQPPLNKLPYLKRRAIVPRQQFIDTPAEDGAADPDTPDLDNVQGDVYFMFPKQWEAFLFFKIRGQQVEQFRKDLAKYAPLITSSRQTAKDIIHIDGHKEDRREIVSTGIAFARAGLNTLGKYDKLQDTHFDNGSLVLEKYELGDRAEYDDTFKTDGATHGVILVTTKAQQTCQDKVNEIKDMFKDSIDIVTVYKGRVRELEGGGDREHFGWRDGISQPAIDCDWDVPKPGQRLVKPGVIIMGYPGDPVPPCGEHLKRPAWTKDGAFMVFRKLEQNVLFFEDYINEYSWTLHVPGVMLDEEQKKALFGARMFGRFKSGVPLALSPYIEDLEYQKPEYINKFDYTEEGGGCPLSAHIRKTEPRNLLPIVSKEFLDASVIIRSGIPYGDEISAQDREDWEKVPKEDRGNAKSPRGLLFVCYQSSIHNGFYRQTTGFANNDYFPITSLAPDKIGQDPIIGGPQPKTGASGRTGIEREGLVTLNVINTKDEKFTVSGVAKKDDTSDRVVPEEFFVTSRGGEYYFVPSIQTVKDWAEGK